MHENNSFERLVRDFQVLGSCFYFQKKLSHDSVFDLLSKLLPILRIHSLDLPPSQ